ncbi:MAG: hypothetical protein RBT63_03805 [Bdellovibrionales bacterium]|jgi:hypothetical protein|nr:hypothetical protein [Bdellovibrionales bacterium]
MLKCILITNDTRAAIQIHGWFRLLANEPYLEIHNQLASFEKKYEHSLSSNDLLVDAPPAPNEQKGEPEPSEGSDTAALKTALEAEARISPIRLLIVDLDVLDKAPLQWLLDTKEKLTKQGHISGAIPFHLLLLGYDDPQLKPERFRHDAIDDMVLKPLDQQLLLQKIELLLAEQPDSEPTFLFRAPAEETVEIGKDTIVDEVADFAISIRNPAPIAHGVFAHIHSSIFGSTVNESRIQGRCYASIAHPQYEGLWLVRFSLFGLSNQQLAEVRKFVRSRQVPTRSRLSAANRAPASGKSDLLPPRHRLAVIDLNRDFLEQAKSTIEENFDRTAVTLFPSYTRLLANLAKLSDQTNAQGAPADENHSGVESENGIPGGRLSLVIEEGSYSLLRFEPPIALTETFLGKPIKEWLDKPKEWLQSIPEADQEDLQEFLEYTSTGSSGVTGLRLLDSKGQPVYAEAKGRFIQSSDPETPSTLHLELVKIDQAAWLDLNRFSAKSAAPDEFRFDAIIIDGSLIRTDVQGWLTGLQTALVNAKVLSSKDELPKIFVMASEESNVKVSSFMHKAISDFIYKPLDRKLLTDKIAVALPDLMRLTLPETSPFVPCEITAQICKSVLMEELAEFGLTIRHPTPIKPRVFMRFFSPLLGEALEGVLARCTSSQAGTNENPLYRCHFVFFGCTDELHKRIRNWIREDYVHKKEATE